jgi:PAS domain S-box-containing protein
MKQRLGVSYHNLTVQMVLSFMILALVTAGAAGLPAFLLIRHQIERQAWAQVNQGSQATQALYVAWQSKVTDLADLTAQRPTLPELLASGEETALLEYLQTLQQDTDLDLVLICDPAQQPILQVGQGVVPAMCQVGEPATWYVVSAGALTRVWLLAGRPIGDTPPGSDRQPGGDTLPGSGKVIAGIALDNEFAAQMQAQTGLEHTLLVNEQPVMSSLAGGVTTWQAISRQAATAPIDINRPTIFRLDDRPYYATHLPLATVEITLTDEVALAVSDITATRQQFAWILAGSITGVALIGSVLGVFLARRIGRPLDHLTRAAATLSTGDLDTAVSVQPGVHEVTLVAQTLERARVDLQHMLTELRQAKAWTDHLLEAIVEGIVTLDQYGRITFFSPGAERITGWSQHDVLHRSCNKVFKPVGTDEPFSRFIPLPGGQRKVILELAGGRQATLSVTGARLRPPASGEGGVALVFRDVSESEVVHRLLGHFLANITHEFRTPLSALAASAELLLDQAGDLSPAERQELLTSLHLGIVSLQTLVDNLLESSSLEAGRFRIYPRPSDLGQIIAEATRTMQPLQAKYGQRLVVELPAAIPLVQVDPRRVVQVLVNLLANAIKYSPDETEIMVQATVSNGWVQVAVADRGPGVPPGYRPDLFRRFIHSGSEVKAQYGAGLGLSVVKAVVEAHGGQVEVEDRPGGGAIFWFTLPRVKES